MGPELSADRAPADHVEARWREARTADRDGKTTTMDADHGPRSGLRRVDSLRLAGLAARGHGEPAPDRTSAPPRAEIVPASFATLSLAQRSSQHGHLRWQWMMRVKPPRRWDTNRAKWRRANGKG